MPTNLYGGLPEDRYRDMAKNAVVDYWNSSDTLSESFGTITAADVFVVWQVKVIQNNKALLGVNVEGDGMYFEYTYNGDAKESYLDVYSKVAKVTAKH